MSRSLAACLALLLVAAADGPPSSPLAAALPHASGSPAGPGPGCGGGFIAARGDTLYSIARRCETSVAELVQENRLGRAGQLETGRRLAIPGFAEADEAPKPPEAAPPPPPPRDRREVRVRTRVAVTEPPPLPPAPRRLPGMRPPGHRPPSPPGPPPPPLPPAPPPRAGGPIYHFQAGDTLYSLARWARTTLPALRAANPDVDPRDIDVGDPIRLPPGAARPEPLRLRERGRPAPMPAVAPAPPPRLAPPPLPSRPARTAPPPDEDEADKPGADDEDEVTPGGMDDGEPEPDGM